MWQPQLTERKTLHIRPKIFKIQPNFWLNLPFEPGIGGKLIALKDNAISRFLEGETKK